MSKDDAYIRQRDLTDAELDALERVLKTKELSKELGQRGTAEVRNGIVTQITQAIGESDTEVEFLQFGEMRKRKIIPIDEACAKCDHCHFNTAKECQERQAEDARARGFTKLICPEQFVGG